MYEVQTYFFDNKTSPRLVRSVKQNVIAEVDNSTASTFFGIDRWNSLPALICTAESLFSSDMSHNRQENASQSA